VETNLPVIPPLNYMLGHSGRTNPLSAGHLTFLVKHHFAVNLPHPGPNFKLGSDPNAF